MRLTDIDVERRLRAAREAARFEVDAGEKMMLFAAALHPSNRVYWISAA